MNRHARPRILGACPGVSKYIMSSVMELMQSHTVNGGWPDTV